MRILFVHNGYHMNHDPRVKALQDGGHEVKHIQMSLSSRKFHDPICNPVKLGRSRLSKYIKNILQKLLDVRIHEMRWSPVIRLWQEMKCFNPDIVIARDYYINTGIALFFGRLLGAKGIIQEQSPVRVGTYHTRYNEDMTWKKKAVHKIYDGFSLGPLLRISPVKGQCQDSKSSQNTFYVPFTFNPEVYILFGEKKHFDGGFVNIICVSTYKKRKRILMLLNAIVELDLADEIRVTIVGSKSKKHMSYYNKVVDYISSNGLRDTVTLKTNLNWETVQQEYSNHDLFVLPSEREPAAVSPLEAMAAGLPVICSDTNGTKDYIIEGETGYIFRTESKWDLMNKLQTAVEDKQALQRMGRKAYATAHESYHPDRYCERMEQIVNQEFNI